MVTGISSLGSTSVGIVLSAERRLHQIVTTSTPASYRARHYGRCVGKILIVEDDNVIADGMARHLTAAGLDPIVVGRGELGLARLRFENPDVCVLDLMLPELDGWKLIETARSEGIGTPIVVVSARGTEHDRVHALEIGADDYLVKPFSMRELVARVGAAARRGVRPAEDRRGEAIEIEELRIDPREVQAFVDGKSAGLTPTEFKLLYTLALERGRVVTRDELLQKVWGRRETHRDRTVDVFVRRLRQKVDRIAPTHTFIHTRFGVGYKLEPVSPEVGAYSRAMSSRRRDEPVRLTRIYTRGGDGGRDVARGRVARLEARPARARLRRGRRAELAARLGAGRRRPTRGSTRIQNELFDLGADLSVPCGEGDGKLRIEQAAIDRLEADCDEANAPLSELRSFVLPGGSETAARLHVARAVCRRAEREVLAVGAERALNPLAAVYLNRLSDLLFVLARAANAGGEEPLWLPGGER